MKSSKTAKRVVIYVRVSTQEQAREGFSIPAQIEALRAFAKSQGWRSFMNILKRVNPQRILTVPNYRNSLKI
jgi:site-specific DNA recombinase